eukprot:jgi/Hompol1/1600/HPOL_004796-RA
MEAPTTSPIVPLGRLIALIWKATGDSDTGTRNEGGRVIVNIVRTLSRSKATQFLNILFDLSCITPIVQIITGAVLTKNVQQSPSNETMSELEEHHVHFDAQPSEKQVFPMVQNEGLVALTLLCSMDQTAASRIVRYTSSLTPTLINILKSGVSAFSSGSIDRITQISQPGRTSTGASPRGSITDEYVYTIQTKTNVCLLLRTLMTLEGKSRLDSVLGLTRTRDFAASISPDLKPVVQVLFDNATHNGSDEGEAPAPVQLQPKAAPLAPRRPEGQALSRTDTRSYKPVKDGMPTNRELQTHFMQSMEAIADPQLSFRESLRQLLEICK